MLLEVENVTAGYRPSIDVVKDVLLRVDERQIVCIIGPNGAGKSTLLKTIFGFLAARSGEIIFNGEKITNLKPAFILKRGVCYVLQGRSIFPYISVLENLELGAYIERDRDRVKESVNKVMDKFPMLSEKSRESAGSLSGGQQRILELARALMLSPKMMLLDEPSLGLSPKITDQVFLEIQRIRDGGVAVLLVEQNAKRALEISDYAYVLDGGRNRYEGPAEQIMNDEKIKKVYLGG